MELHAQNLLKSLYRFILRHTAGDDLLTREILSDTYLSARRSFSTFSHKSALLTWMCSIALSRLHDHYRRHHRTSKLILPLTDRITHIVSPTLTPEEQLVTAELVTSVKRCLSHLPTRYRHLLELKYYHQLSHRQISVRVGVSERSVEGLLYRARAAFRRLYRP